MRLEDRIPASAAYLLLASEDEHILEMFPRLVTEGVLGWAPVADALVTYLDAEGFVDEIEDLVTVATLSSIDDDGVVHGEVKAYLITKLSLLSLERPH